MEIELLEGNYSIKITYFCNIIQRNKKNASVTNK